MTCRMGYKPGYFALPSPSGGAGKALLPGGRSHAQGGRTGAKMGPVWRKTGPEAIL